MTFAENYKFSKLRRESMLNFHLKSQISIDQLKILNFKNSIFQRKKFYNITNSTSFVAIFNFFADF